MSFEFLVSWQFWVIIVLLIISGIAKAVQDTLEFHYWKSFFATANHQNWWNPMRVGKTNISGSLTLS